MRIVIAGGHGKIALLLAQSLTLRGDHVHALIRDPDQAADIAATGGVPVIYDMERDTPADLAAAVAGSDAVVFAAGRRRGQRHRAQIHRRSQRFGATRRRRRADRRSAVRADFDDGRLQPTRCGNRRGVGCLYRRQDPRRRRSADPRSGLDDPASRSAHRHRRQRSDHARTAADSARFGAARRRRRDARIDLGRGQHFSPHSSWSPDRSPSIRPSRLFDSQKLTIAVYFARLT